MTAAALSPVEDTRRARIVALARGWIGTPYAHQASCRGAGADCLGLVVGVWRDLRNAPPPTLPAYSPDWGETGPGEPLLQALHDHLAPATGAMMPGQVLVMRMRAGRMAKHLGILTHAGDAPRFVHAYQAHGTVESPLGPWARRVVARFELI